MSADLFGKAEPAAPLAERLRPKSIDEVVGQEHLLGPGKPLRLAFESGKPHSMILWGPPGSGKTTIARLMAKTFDAEFVALSAVFSGVKDIREAMQEGLGTRKVDPAVVLRAASELARIASRVPFDEHALHRSDH